MQVCGWNGLAAILVTKRNKRSPGVTPEVNLRKPLHTGDKACKQGNPPWLWNPVQISPEVQNRGISGPTKKTSVLQKNLKARMHSSRMCTVHCSSRLLGVGGVCAEGVSAKGGSAQGRCLPRGDVCPGGSVCSGGCLPGGGLPKTPLLWTEWQTLVKTLPCRNYVADGKKKNTSVTQVLWQGKSVERIVEFG